jgi:hypothetical protein
MAMNQIIAQVVLLQQIIIAQHWNTMSALLFFQELVDMPLRVRSIWRYEKAVWTHRKSFFWECF